MKTAFALMLVSTMFLMPERGSGVEYSAHSTPPAETTAPSQPPRPPEHRRRTPPVVIQSTNFPLTNTAGTASSAVRLRAPASILPQEGAVFHHFPRTTELVWEAVVGAVSYSLEVDCFHCCKVGEWCSEVDKPSLAFSGVLRTSQNIRWMGANKGRWRVWAVDKDNVEGEKSPWREFSFTQ